MCSQSFRGINRGFASVVWRCFWGERTSSQRKSAGSFTRSRQAKTTEGGAFKRATNSRFVKKQRDQRRLTLLRRRLTLLRRPLTLLRRPLTLLRRPLTLLRRCFFPSILAWKFAKSLLKSLLQRGKFNIEYFNGNHKLSENHRHDDETFSYPTVGVPVPGKKYNNTKVEPKDLEAFDNEINELFKPYNVSTKISRTPTASSRELVTR